ncbi:MAG: hypothetical protein ABI446_09415 [Gemmatimonadaceae bacterium]
MADELKPQQKWYHSAPGYLTATAALVGAITAAVTGLSQLGVFHSKTAAPAAVVAPVAAPSSNASQRTTHRTPESRGSSRTQPSAPVVHSAPLPVTVPPAATPAPAPAPAPPPAPVAKMGSIGPGTTLELASGSRVCSNGSSEGDKFTTTTVTPVSGSNGVSLPVGTQVILSVVMAQAPVFITAKGVSIDVAGKAVPISGTGTAHTEFNAAPSAKGIGLGACIPEGGRVSLRLTDGVSVTQP